MDGGGQKPRAGKSGGISTPDQDGAIADNKHTAHGEQDLQEPFAGYALKQKPLQEKTDESRRHHTAQQSQEEVMGDLDDGESDIGSQQIRRAVGEIQDIHQTKND